MIECKKAWETAQAYLLSIKTLMSEMQNLQNPLVPFHKFVGDGLKEVQNCMQKVQNARTACSDVRAVRKLLGRGTLKNQADECVTMISKTLQIFQVFDLPAHLLNDLNFPQTRLAFANFYLVTSQQPMQTQTNFGVLQCPPPDKYFVGRAETLDKLSKIFSSTVVTIYGESQEALKKFVQRLHLQ